jgi:AcrR family transcriptional regulator
MSDAALMLDPATDCAKRQQVLDGARRVFLEQGFDGASINDIVRVAGVSKGTLYAYFPSKEKLFETLVALDKRQQVERGCSAYINDMRPVSEVLLEIARTFPSKVMENPQGLAYVRMVMGAAAKFPEIGRAFYDAGPRYGNEMMARFLKARMESGELAIEEWDIELAAHQFIDLCNSALLKARMFCVEEEFTPERRERIAQSAVRVFLAAYGA